MEESTVLYEKKDGIGIIRLNRPDVSNRINSALLHSLDQAVTTACADDEVRVIIVAANGNDFCGGFDITDKSSSLGPDATWEDRRKNTHEEIEVWMKILGSRKPFIGALKGWVIGGGYALALTCDCLVAADNTIMDNTEFAAGMAYVSYTPLEAWKLPMNIAKEKLFTGYSIAAEEGRRIGLINHVVPLEKVESCAFALAKRMLKLAPYTLTMHKAFTNMAYDLKGIKHIIPFAEEAFNISRTLPGTEENQRIWEYGTSHTGEELIQMTERLFAELREEEKQTWKDEKFK